MDRVILADRVLTEASAEYLIDAAVWLDDEVIVEVGPRERIEAQAPVEAVRATYAGATVLPGMVNCHLHLSFDASKDPVGALSADGDLLGAAAERARRLLTAGITTVRDLGDLDFITLALRQEINDGRRPGPRILSAGPPLTVPGGHCWFLGGEVRGEQQIRERVQHSAARGVDVIKVMASGGQLTPGGAPMWQSQFSARELTWVVQEATACGLPVAAHAHGADAIEDAVHAGVSTIEHCTWMTAEGGPEPRERVAKEMADLGIAVCAASGPNWHKLKEYVGPERAAALHGRLTWLNERGVALLPGTDAGLPGSSFDDLVGSLELYQHLGFDNRWILGFATIGAAEHLQVGAGAGRIAPGNTADLIVVDGDPVADLTALRSVQLTVAQGRFYPAWPSPQT